MKLFNEITAQMQKYYVERDLDALCKIRRLVCDEIDDPELQEAVITVPGKLDPLEQAINSQGFLRMVLDEADSTGPVIAGRLIRLFPANREEDDGCMVLNVAHIDDTHIILVSPGGGQ